MGGNLSKLHEYLKNQESLITSAVEGKTLLDFIDRNANEYPDHPALNSPANAEYSAWDSISWSEYRLSLIHISEPTRQEASRMPSSA